MFVFLRVHEIGGQESEIVEIVLGRRSHTVRLIVIQVSLNEFLEARFNRHLQQVVFVVFALTTSQRELGHVAIILLNQEVSYVVKRSYVKASRHWRSIELINKVGSEVLRVLEKVVDCLRELQDGFDVFIA